MCFSKELKLLSKELQVTLAICKTSYNCTAMLENFRAMTDGQLSIKAAVVSIPHSHQNLRCLKSRVSQFSAVSSL